MQAFSRKEQERLFLLRGKAQGGAELLAIETVLSRLAHCVEGEAGGRSQLAGLQSVGRREGIASIHGVVAEKSINGAVQGIGSRLAYDVDGSAAGRAQLAVVVGAVDLEFLHRVLAKVHQHGAGIAVELPSIHGDIVPTPVASVERESGLRGLANTKISSIHRSRIGDSRFQ